jgi:hypothetical protein
MLLRLNGIFLGLCRLATHESQAEHHRWSKSETSVVALSDLRLPGHPELDSQLGGVAPVDLSAPRSLTELQRSQRLLWAFICR